MFFQRNSRKHVPLDSVTSAPHVIRCMNGPSISSVTVQFTSTPSRTLDFVQGTDTLYIMLRTIFCTLYFSPLLYRLYWNLNDCVFVWHIWSVGIEGKTNLFTLPHYMGLIINLNLKYISRLGWRATWSRSNGWIFRTPSVLVLCVGFAGVKDAAGRSLSKCLHFDEGSAMVKEMNASGNTSLICMMRMNSVSIHMQVGGKHSIMFMICPLWWRNPQGSRDIGECL